MQNIRPLSFCGNRTGTEQATKRVHGRYGTEAERKMRPSGQSSCYPWVNRRPTVGPTALFYYPAYRIRSADALGKAVGIVRFYHLAQHLKLVYMLAQDVENIVLVL